MSTVEKEEGEESVLLIVLPYLHSLYELFSTSLVSRSLRDAIRNETALWTKIVIAPPLSSRLTDDILFEITSKSAGKLNTLVLWQCNRVTDKGLRRVVDANPLIKKIIVPGCTELSPEGIIGCVESLSKNNHYVETLHINGIYRFTKQHLSALYTYLPNEGAIDLEICSRCDEVRMIPVCPRPSCKQTKEQRKCKECWYCIPRCAECYVCLGPDFDFEIEEAACDGDVLCLECWLVLPKCSLCNKAYCTNHSSQWHVNVLHDVFECDDCHYRTSRLAYDSFDYQI